jgi:tetratricopeptide (TPR) repeat protein
MDKNIEKIKNLVVNSRTIDAIDFTNKLLKKNKNPIYYNIKGALFLMNNQEKLAIDPLLKSIKLSPDFADAYANLGMAYHKNFQNDKATIYLEKAISLNEGFIEAKLNLALVYFSIREFFKAIETLKNLLLQNPEFIEALKLLGDCLSEVNNVSEAIKYHEAALKLDMNPDNLYSLGLDYLFLGNTERAIDCLKPILHSHIASNLTLAVHTNYEFNKSDIDFLMKEFEENNDSVKRAVAGFALARILKKKKNFKESFEILTKANKLRSIDDPFDQKSFSKKINNIKEYYYAIDKLNIDPTRYDLRPIFIVGTPRSGTTYLEQIISNHPDVYGAGEIARLDLLFEKAILSQNKSQNSLFKLRNNFYSYIKNMTNKKYFIDKTPINSFYVGLIKKIFPEAYIINTKRDYKSIAFSMYENNFVAEGLKYTYSQEDIVFYLKSYKENIAFWSEQKFNNFLTVDLKKFINEIDYEAKKVFSFLGLDFSINYLDITANKKPVRTVSASQVRNNKTPPDLYNVKNYGKVIDKFNLLIDEI